MNIVDLMRRSGQAPSRRIGPGRARERVLMLALAGVLGLLLLSSGVRAVADAMREARAVADAKERREMVLASAGVVEARLAAASGKGVSRTGTEALAAIEAHARAAGLSAEAGAPVKDLRGAVELHRLRVMLRAAPMEKLLQFETRLRQETGLVIERFSLESREGDGGLTATYEITLCRIAA